MQAITKIIPATLLTLVTASPALAAAREDHSGIIICAFLGFCALIVVAQLLPALLIMLGVVKGAAKESKHVHAHAHVHSRDKGSSQQK